MASEVIDRLKAAMTTMRMLGVPASTVHSVHAGIHEIDRLRKAVDSLLYDIDGDHIPEWASEEAKAAGKQPWCCRLCGPADGGWPCSHRMALDELKEALK